MQLRISKEPLIKREIIDFCTYERVFYSLFTRPNMCFSYFVDKEKGRI